MRYRRLGRTEWLVSEVGLTARGLEQLPAEEAETLLRTAFSAGLSLVALDLRDDLPDLEQLVGRVAGSDRPRIAIISVLSSVPAPEVLAPAVEAAAVRLGGDGTLDAVALPGVPGADHLLALEELKARGVLRAAGVATSDPAIATEAIEAGWADLLVAPLNPARRLAMRPALERAAQRDVGVVLAGRVGEAQGAELVAWGLSERGVHAVAAGLSSAAAIDDLLRGSTLAPLDARRIEALEAAIER